MLTRTHAADATESPTCSFRRPSEVSQNDGRDRCQHRPKWDTFHRIGVGQAGGKPLRGCKKDYGRRGVDGGTGTANVLRPQRRHPVGGSELRQASSVALPHDRHIPAYRGLPRRSAGRDEARHRRRGRSAEECRSAPRESCRGVCTTPGMNSRPGRRGFIPARSYACGPDRVLDVVVPVVRQLGGISTGSTACRASPATRGTGLRIVAS